MSITLGSVASRDGTTIGYRQLGRGPGVVVLHGAMSSGHNHVQLAEALAARFTVYIPDRRGRGLSGRHGDGYTISTEVEDLDALLAQTGAHNLFGVSSGGLIALQAALTLPAIRKAAIFEPPLIFGGSAQTSWLARYDDEIARGQVAAALVTAMKGTRLGPPVLNLMPRWLLELMTKRIISHEDKRGSGDYVSMRAIAPTLRYDFRLAVEMKEKLEGLRSMRAEVLLLGGAKSPAYFKAALDALERILPRVERVELSGLDHAASWNTDRRGQPERLARELLSFF